MHDDPKKRAVLERAETLFQQYYASCFWHLKPNLTMTKDMIPVIVKGLRIHGGRSAFLAADLLEKESQE